MAKFALPSSSLSSSSSSSSLSSSSTFWLASPPPPRRWLFFRFLPTPTRSSISKRQILVIAIFILVIVIVLVPPPQVWFRQEITLDISSGVLRPVTAQEDSNKVADPERWLLENSNDKHAVTNKHGIFSLRWHSTRPKSALISLVRNAELEGMMQSMRQLEYHWNRKYQYPWIFFNDEPFSEEFKRATQNLTSAPCHYELIPTAHWSLPTWISSSRFMNSLEYLGAIGVGKGWMISYRHMCRWNSGFFYRHPALLAYDFYWRVEPSVHFFCAIDYDVFRFVAANNIKYGFNMNILDDARSFPSLWRRTREFLQRYPELVHEEAELDWLLDARNGGEYNNCQFFSNFEVGDLRWFRGEANERYFEWLDRGGGFFNERFGDAPIHTLSVAMFVPKREIWFFRDVGYQHDINRHCPPHLPQKCTCEPTPLDENFYKLVPLESPQKKPADTCIRQFLGGKWLEKRANWSQHEEKALGGDGYGGYVLSGMEEGG